MKNNRLLIIALLALGISTALMTKPAYAQDADDPYYDALQAAEGAADATEAASAASIAAPGVPVSDVGARTQTQTQSIWQKVIKKAESIYNQAEKQKDRAENNAKTWMDKQIANNMSDKQKAQINAAADRDVAQRMVNDAQKDTERAQAAAAAADERNQDATLAAIARNKPSQTDCVNITSDVVKRYNQQIAFQTAAPLATTDINSLKNPQPQAVVRQQISSNINQAISSPTSQNIYYNPDESVVLQICTDSNCYNKWVTTQDGIKLQQTVGDGFPSKAANNPQMVAYRIKYAGWLAARSKNRNILRDTEARVMFKSPDNYTQALNAYIANTGASSSDAANYISGSSTVPGIYPNSAKLGLTAREMDSIIYISLMSKANSGGSDADKEALARAQAAVNSDEELFRKHEAALDAIVSPDAAPTNGIGSTNSASGTTTGP